MEVYSNGGDSISALVARNIAVNANKQKRLKEDKEYHSVMRQIQQACHDGEYKLVVSSLSESTKSRLVELGYSINVGSLLSWTEISW